MTGTQRDVIQSNLNNEKKVIRELKQVYNQASKDVESKISELNARTDMQNLQSTVYQRQYQEALQNQLNGILDSMQTEEFTTISGYLEECYTNGYVGSMYDIASQGIPVITPINQDQVVRALMTDSNLSTSMYNRLGEDVNYLKNSIRAELSRGIAQGGSWLDMAARIANGMNSPFDTALNNSIRIARTEGNRIQNEAQLDAMQEAKDAGADVVKQWCATLDGDTREEHQELDGQIREIDDEFEVAGYSAMAPGEFGEPEMDINCRCCMLQRARWGLDADELKELEERAEFYGLDKTDDFEDFKEKYLDATSEMTPEAAASEQEYDSVTNAISEHCDDLGVAYNEVAMHDSPLSEDEIIAALSGGDKTSGSCASLGLAYVGQKGGMNVLDFRGGNSQDTFSSYLTLREIASLPGANTTFQTARSTVTVGNKLVKQVEQGKQYYLAVGRHAAIVQKTDEGVLQYLEMQSATKNGWVDFDENPRYTFSTRFGCTQTGFDYEGFMIDVDSLKDSDDLKKILGYINTASDSQMKGSSGYAK